MLWLSCHGGGMAWHSTAQKTMLAERMETAGGNAGLDTACKRLMANKLILVWIMKYTVKEYRDYEVSIIAERFIAGNPL